MNKIQESPSKPESILKDIGYNFSAKIDPLSVEDPFADLGDMIANNYEVDSPRVSRKPKDQTKGASSVNVEVPHQVNAPETLSVQNQDKHTASVCWLFL